MLLFLEWLMASFFTVDTTIRTYFAGIWNLRNVPKNQDEWRRIVLEVKGFTTCRNYK